jgi:hypothetical protein
MCDKSMYNLCDSKDVDDHPYRGLDLAAPSGSRAPGLDMDGGGGEGTKAGYTAYPIRPASRVSSLPSEHATAAQPMIEIRDVVVGTVIGLVSIMQLPPL